MLNTCDIEEKKCKLSVVGSPLCGRKIDKSEKTEENDSWMGDRVAALFCHGIVCIMSPGILRIITCVHSISSDQTCFIPLTNPGPIKNPFCYFVSDF